MKYYSGTFGHAYGNWGVLETKERIVSYDSRHFSGIHIKTITEEELQRMIDQDYVHSHYNIGYMSDVYNQFVLSLPEDGSYEDKDGEFLLVKE